MLESNVLFLRWVFTVTMAGCLIACGQQEPPDTQSIAEIKAARMAFWEAHERGDASALADLVTEDAVLWGPGMEEVRGRPSIRFAAEGMFAALSISDFEIESQELELYDDVAYELATYQETMTPQGGQASTVRGRYLIVWKLDSDGRWRVQRNMFHFVNGAQ